VREGVGEGVMGEIGGRQYLKLLIGRTKLL